MCAELLAAAAAVDASDEAQIICTHSRPRACVRPRTPTKVIYGQLGSATSGWKGRRNGLTGASSALPLPQSNEGGGACHTGKHFHRNCTRIRPARRQAGRPGLPCMQPWWEGPPTCGLRASRPVNMPTLSFGMTRSTNILSSCLLFRVHKRFNLKTGQTPLRWRQCTTRARACAACTRFYSRGGRRQRCAYRRRGSCVVACAWCSAFGAGAISLDPHQAGQGSVRPLAGAHVPARQAALFAQRPARRTGASAQERALACRSRTLESLHHAAPAGRRQCQRPQEPLGMRAQCSPAVCHPALHRPRVRTHVRQSARTRERQRARTHASLTMNHLSLSARPHARTRSPQSFSTMMEKTFESVPFEDFLVLCHT